MTNPVNPLVSGRTGIDTAGNVYHYMPPSLLPTTPVPNPPIITGRIVTDGAGNIFEYAPPGLMAIGTGPPPPLPVCTVTPVITGALASGSTLTCDGGTWNPSGVITYQWQSGGVNIPGQTASSYITKTGDVGNMIACVVTSTNAGGTVSATSNSVGPITSVATNVQTWNPSDLVNATVSGSNLTATAVASKTGGGRGIYKTSGKCYWEVSFNQWNGNSTGAGIANLSASLANPGAIANTAGIAIAEGSSALFINGSQVFTFGSIGSTGRLGFAVDTNAKLIWIRLNGGAWPNGGNPSNGTGGFDISSLGSNYYPMFGFDVTSDQCFALFGAGSFFDPVPSGFTSLWSS